MNDYIGKITCADCLDILKQLPDKCVDLVLTDPPYNVSRPNNFTSMGSAARQGMDFGEWDKDFDIVGWITPMSRVLKDNANVVIFNAWENLKDIKVFQKLVDLLSNENDLVLDCFSGSGTTAVACHKLKRRFICIEKDPKYWKASCDRLEQEQRQQTLF